MQRQASQNFRNLLKFKSPESESMDGQQDASAQSLDLTMTCEPSILVADKGQTFRCSLPVQSRSCDITERNAVQPYQQSVQQNCLADLKYSQVIFNNKRHHQHKNSSHDIT